MKIIQKKCPYCGADTQYKYGEHELKCSHCRQSCIIEYERPSFNDLIKMKEHCINKIVELNQMICAESDFYGHYGDSLEQLEAAGKRVEEWGDERDRWTEKKKACEQMLDEAIDVEIMRKDI